MKLKVVQTAKSLGLDNTFFSARRTYHYEEQSLWYQTCSLGFPDSSIGKESACNVGDPGLIPGLGRSPGEGNGYPLQYSGPENSMGYTVHGVAKNWTRLKDFNFSHVLPI